jgi:hypothetical protein
MGEAVAYKCFKEFMREYKKQIDIERRIANALEKQNEIVTKYDLGALDTDKEVEEELE